MGFGDENGWVAEGVERDPEEDELVEDEAREDDELAPEEDESGDDEQ